MKNLNKNWSGYYEGHTGIALSNIILHWPYMLSILFSRPQNILEIGCGPADHSRFISKLFPLLSVYYMDNDAGIVKQLQKQIRPRSRVILADVTNEKDIKKCKFKKDMFDIVYSQGLMEHFKKTEFRNIILNFLPYAKKTLFSVPTDHYPNRDFGNEILRTKQELQDLLSTIPGINFTVQSYFPDISIRTKLIRIQKYRMGLSDSMQYLLLGSNHYLVTITKK